MKPSTFAHSVRILLCTSFVLNLWLWWSQSTCSVHEDEGSAKTSVDINNYLFTEPKIDGECVAQNVNLTIANLKDFTKTWNKSADCRTLLTVFEHIFTLHNEDGTLQFDDVLRKKMSAWLGHDPELLQQAEHQSVTIINNKVMDESSMYNDVRARRPVVDRGHEEMAYLNNLVQEAAKSCDFCPERYEQHTGRDSRFGRLQTEHSYTAANVFKLATWHSMIVFRSHHPHMWTRGQYNDVIHLASLWFNKVHDMEPSYQYPVILWDMLPKAGASQIHPHIHTLLTNHGYHGHLGSWYHRAQQYTHGDYYSDLIMVQSALGLAVKYVDGDGHVAWALPSLTPIRDHETVLLSTSMNRAFTDLLYAVIRAFIDDIKKLSFSLAIALPPMGQEMSMQYPAIARIATRTTISEIRSDVTSLELFAAANVNTDPFQTVKIIQQSVKTRL